MAVPAPARSRSMPALLRSCQPRQLEALQNIVTKRITDPSMADIAHTDDFTVTSTERGVQRVEHQHIATALDVLNTYQVERKAKSMMNVLGVRAGIRRHYKHDPRTRLVELLKRWLRNNAANGDLSEDEVRNMSGLCRDVISQHQLFYSRNPRSFIQSIAEVYKHLQLQLREVLKRTRTCAELAQHAISLSRNLVSDAIAYLLLAATDLKQTDDLPSLEAVALWESLPSKTHPLPKRADPKLQGKMSHAWSTHCGSLIAGLLSTPWCVRLFEGIGAEEQAVLGAAALVDGTDGGQVDAMLALLEKVRAQFEGGHFKNSGLAGAFRKPKGAGTRQAYLDAVEAVFDLTYLIGGALVQFSRISDGTGDLGMICAAPWLHPFLEALMEKVQRLKGLLESLDRDVDEHLVLTRARGLTVEKPAPTTRMSTRAQGVIERAVKSRESHVSSILHVLQELRTQSAPERLPELKENLSDVVMHLDSVLSSPAFLARVGDNFPVLPPLRNLPGITRRQSAIAHSGNNLPEVFDISVTDTAEDLACTPSLVGLQWREDMFYGRSDDSACSQGTSECSVSAVGPLSFKDEEHQLQDIGCQVSAIGTDSTVDTSSSVTPREVLVDFRAMPAPGDAHHVQQGEGGALAPKLPVRGCFQRVAAATAGNSWRRSSSVPALRMAGALPETRRAATTMLATTDSELTMQVNRLSVGYSGRGWRKHDSRTLRLRDGQLDIFDKGSRYKVKTHVNVVYDVDTYTRLSDRITSLIFRRATKNGCQGNGVEEHKFYYFEFLSGSDANAFHVEMSRLLARRQSASPAHFIGSRSLPYQSSSRPYVVEAETA